MSRFRSGQVLVLSILLVAGVAGLPGRASASDGHAHRSSAAALRGATVAGGHADTTAANRANPGVAGPNVKMNQDPDGNPQNEVWITMDPSDPTHLIGGANDYRGGATGTGFYASTDGGSVWDDGLMPMPTGVDSGGDPQAKFNADGSTAYFSQLGFESSGALLGCDPASGVFVSTSTTDGTTWGTAARLASNGATLFNDKPSLLADTTTGNAGKSGNVYLAYTKFNYSSLTDCQNDSATTSSPIVLRRSTNGATSWDAEVNVSGTFTDAQGSAMAFAPDGTLYVAFEAFAPCSACLVVAKSTNGGQSFTQTQVASFTPLDSLPAGSGMTFRADVFPTVAVDSNGVVYIAWNEKRNGSSTTDIWWSKGNGGAGWSAPQRVNQNTSGDQWFPAMAIDAGNAVYVAYSDRRDDPSNILYNMYVSHSHDGGGSWADTKVSSAQSDPRAVTFGSDLFIGDYNGFDVARDGSKGWASWTDTRNSSGGSGEQDAFAGRVDFNNSGAATTLTSAISPSIGVWGTTFTLSGMLAQGGTGQAGQQILVQKRPIGTGVWSNVMSAATNGSGAYSAAVGKPDRHTDYRGMFQGTASLLSSTSPARTALVRVGIPFGVTDSTLTRGQTAQFTGSVLPVHPGKKVQVQQLTNSGWVTIQTVTLDSASRFRGSARLTVSGFRLYRAVYATQDSDHAWNISRNVGVTWS